MIELVFGVCYNINTMSAKTHKRLRKFAEKNGQKVTRKMKRLYSEMPSPERIKLNREMDEYNQG